MKPALFSSLDIMIGAGWFLIILTVFLFIWMNNKEKEHYRFFLPALLFKLFFAFFFAFVYVKIMYDGGDTLEYWQGAYNLNQLFWENPMHYFNEILQTPSFSTLTKYFNQETGYPPAWIYKEPESFFISKIISVFTFFTFNSYIALSLICGTIIFLSSWRMFEFLREFAPTKSWIIVFASLFIPTVAFWCSGISKDTFVLAAAQYCIVILLSFLLKKKSFSFKNVVLLLLSSFILYRTRNFMLVAIYGPFFLVFILRIIKKITRDVFFRTILKFFTVFIFMIIAFVYLNYNEKELNNNQFIQEANIKQQDFAQNSTYGGKRYDLEITDYSLVGMIKAIPISIITAFYRPFLWEATSPFLLLSGIEGLLLMYFTFNFFFRSGNMIRHFSFVGNQELLVFALVFTLILGFFAGYTAGLYNVLVRFKAPLMTLLFIFFSAKSINKQAF
ncbi:MAG: hypothetical protein H3C31_11425 [Brumimicrobium sp.]|nr:hypothetical protein [Brumimicrobium sp.]